MNKYNLIIFAIIAFVWAACSDSSGDFNPKDSSGGDSGTGGSMARFTIKGDHLYTVDEQNLNIVDVSNAEDMHKVKSLSVGFGIETIFPYEDKLFLGAQNGMYIFDISMAENPQLLANYQHIYSCDPVVVSGHFAYVTLHSADSWCGRTTNELQIVDISQIENPRLHATYAMTSPQGLGVDETTLFVCDNGLKVFDISNKLNIIEMHHFQIDAFDVIPLNGVLLVIGANGLYQYAYDGQDIQLLSQLQIQ